MGFTPKRKRYNLKFTDPDMAGLEIVATPASMGEFIDIAALADADPAELAQDIGKLHGLFETFAGVLESWNLEDKNKNPVPTTVAGLLSQDMDFILEVIKAWAQSVANVSAPLVQPSTGGAPSLAASIPMETLSQSQAS